MTTKNKCPDCGTGIGKSHTNECDVERCSVCGGQRICCDCENHDPLASAWTGVWLDQRNMSFNELAELHEEEPEEVKEAHMRKYRIVMGEDTETDAFYFLDGNVTGLRLDAQCLQHKTETQSVREFAEGIEHLMVAIKLMSARLQDCQQEASQ